jgi:hypothetical protein
MFGVASIWSTRYVDIDAVSEGPRTSMVTLRLRSAKCRAACPAEFAPPTMYTSWSAQLTASVRAAP